MKRPNFVTLELSEDFEEIDYAIYNEDDDHENLDDLSKGVQKMVNDSKTDYCTYIYQLVQVIKPQRVVYEAEVEHVAINSKPKEKRIIQSEDKI